MPGHHFLELSGIFSQYFWSEIEWICRCETQLQMATAEVQVKWLLNWILNIIQLIFIINLINSEITVSTFWQAIWRYEILFSHIFHRCGTLLSNSHIAASIYPEETYRVELHFGEGFWIPWGKSYFCEHYISKVKFLLFCNLIA